MNEQHPIEGLMITAMNSIQDMVDVNTIIGEPIETANNVVIIPISKVCFGFAAGGSEFRGETIDEYTKRDKEEQVQYRLPFGGGSGAGVNINPVAFLIIQGNNIKLLPVDHTSSIDKLLDYMPDIVEKANNIVNKAMQNNKEEKNKVRQEEIRQKREEEKEQEHYEEKKERILHKTKPKRNREPNMSYEFEYDDPEPKNMQDGIIFDNFGNYDE